MNIRDAQKVVKEFAILQKWDDSPCIDKFDHLHEELTEISHCLRYKDKEERHIHEAEVVLQWVQKKIKS